MKFLQKNGVNYGRSVVGDFIVKSRVKLQAMGGVAFFAYAIREPFKGFSGFQNV